MANKKESQVDEQKENVTVEETIQQADPPAEESKSQQEIIQNIIGRVEDNSKQIEAVVEDLIYEHCQQIDELISKFKQCLLDKENPVTEWELDDVCMKLPTYLYFIGEAQEKFGIKEDIAKSVKMELYNQIHQRTKGTIADKQAASEAGTLEEEIVYRAYQRAYKRIKQKLEAAYELLSSIKKVISRRMGEQELANVDSGRFRRS